MRWAWRCRSTSTSTCCGAEDDGAGHLRFTFEGGAPAGENAIATRDSPTRRAGAASACRRSTLAVRSTIPVQAGLGSSAAAIVAGLRLVHALCPIGAATTATWAGCSTPPPRSKGIPTTSAPRSSAGSPRAARAPSGVTSVASAWPARVRVVIATPRVGLATTKARGVLPATLSRADAVFNVQRTALLLQAVAHRQPRRASPPRSTIACTSRIARRSCPASPTRSPSDIPPSSAPS